MNKLVDDAVEQFTRLPGLGRRSAMRMVLFLLKKTPEEVMQFSNAIARMRNEIKYCSQCCNISESELCDVCQDHKRDQSIVCVVASIQDVMAIEQTSQYKGVYHVLGGIISPAWGIGPGDLTVEELVQRAKSGAVKEVIMALSSTMEGDTTVFYLSRRLQEFDLLISTIARGISVGDELEFADEVTLGRSIRQRIPYEPQITR